MTEYSRDKPLDIKKLLRNWRVKLSIIVIFCLNLELEVIPLILMGLLNLSGQALRIAAGMWSTVEMGWWVYFSSWAPKEVEKSKQVTDVKEATSELIEDVRKDTGRRIEEFVEDQTVDKFDFEKWKNTRLYGLSVKIIKVFGYTFGFIFVLLLSAIPFPGLWIPGLAFCKKNNWKFGYVALFLGNFVKNYFYAYLWEFIWPYRPYIYIIISTIAGSIYFYKKYKKLTWKEILFKVIIYFSKNPKNHQ